MSGPDDSPVASCVPAHRRVVTAPDLLSWLDQQAMSFGELTQPDLERWIEAYPLWMHIADFLRWARRRRITPHELRLPERVSHDPEMMLGDADRSSLLDRCRHDEHLPLDVRAAGALLLLDGLPLNRIVELTTDKFAPEGLCISIDAPVISTPPGTPSAARPAPRATTSPQRRRLDRASQPRPLAVSRPQRQGSRQRPRSRLPLRRHGISAPASRNAALIALAADLPASVLATLLGWTSRPPCSGPAAPAETGSRSSPQQLSSAASPCRATSLSVRRGRQQQVQPVGAERGDYLLQPGTDP
ncbi:hypothetical protein AB0E63_21580 [Kribbella sp. NPDC026596]|uniref:hypothetical protein n=1 Tax=Kribbella sp. NPDC026596 TaxID=3155122 RepID=UPI0033D158B8